MASTSLSTRETIVYQAKLAEQAERYDEMAEFMTNLVKSVTDPLSIEERNLLSVAFKNAVGARRAALRIVSSLEGKQRQRNQAEFVEITQNYHSRVNSELAKICKDIIDLLTNHLLKAVDNDVEAQVFYYKMMGDYYRYLCEFCGDQKSEWTEKAHKAYEKATEVAVTELGPTHPVRLGLALNYSVFHYEILGRQENACKIAKTALDDAIAELSALDEISYRDSTLIMQLLRDNLTLWTTDPDTAAAGGTGAAGGAPAKEEEEP